MAGIEALVRRFEGNGIFLRKVPVEESIYHAEYLSLLKILTDSQVFNEIKQGIDSNPAISEREGYVEFNFTGYYDAKNGIQDISAVKRALQEKTGLKYTIPAGYGNALWAKAGDLILSYSKEGITYGVKINVQLLEAQTLQREPFYPNGILGMDDP